MKFFKSFNKISPLVILSGILVFSYPVLASNGDKLQSIEVGEPWTIDRWISVSSSVSVVLASIIALFTLLELSRQRKRAYQPDIVFGKQPFEQIKDPLTENTYTWVRTSSDPESGNKQHSSHLSFFAIPVYNIGLAVAKNVKIEWEFNLEVLINDINSLIEESEDRVVHNGQFIRWRESAVNAGFLKEELDFILPYSHSKEPVYCKVPTIYSFLVAVYIQLKKSDLASMKIPYLFLSVSFSNIEGAYFKKVFKIFINISWLAEQENGHIQVGAIFEPKFQYLECN